MNNNNNPTMKTGMNTSLLASFFPEQHQVRIVNIDGSPWFVASDVCKYLELGLPANYLRKFNDDKKCTYPIYTAGGIQNLLVISESGLYRLMFRSRRPEAKRFADWVCKEVLPSIRRNGGYIIGQEQLSTGEMSEDDLLARALEIAKARLIRLISERENKTEILSM